MITAQQRPKGERTEHIKSNVINKYIAYEPKFNRHKHIARQSNRFPKAVIPLYGEGENFVETIFSKRE